MGAKAFLMNPFRRLSYGGALLMGGLLLCGDRAGLQADDFGSISGQVVYDGDVPAAKILIMKGDAAAKDAAVCAAADLPEEGLLVDKETKGIANVFVYLEKAPAKVHPDLKKPMEAEVIFDQKNCQFLPHALIVRADQGVRVKSGDPISHNTHLGGIYNSENKTIASNDRTGVVFKVKAERQPIPVKCDIHSFMVANWLILPHGYAAVTDTKGNFTIDKLPAGKHEFRIWHEKVGYIERKYAVTVKGGDAAKLDPVKVAPAKFK